MGSNNGATFAELWAHRFDSRTAFAQACGVPRQYIWRWETGRRQMTAEMCRKVAEILGVSMETVTRALENSK